MFFLLILYIQTWYNEREGKMRGITKKVYMYDLKGEKIKEFETTQDCADYFEKEREYINHNLKYCDKIRKNGCWYRLSREENVFANNRNEI